jgi:hypothetical protein
MVSVLSNILGFSNLIKETKQTRLDIMLVRRIRRWWRSLTIYLSPPHNDALWTYKP